jgi:GNAT superfamily N-acetyltransferase
MPRARASAASTASRRPAAYRINGGQCKNPTMSTTSPHHLRRAEPRDCVDIVGLVSELADFERLLHLMQMTPESLHRHLFADHPVVECLVGEVDGEVVAFALFFTNFSTFLGKPGLYLEDLYVKPAHRGTGLGRALLTALAQLAVERDYGRFEWSVLDWNSQAIGFYESRGATLMADWRICRVTGEALARLGAATSK